MSGSRNLSLDDTTADDAPVLDMPPIATVERLIAWHDHRATADGRLALSLEAENLTVAAGTNRRRAGVHRVTATCLRALRQQLQPTTPSQARAPP